jgi:hypothetical protein
VARNRTASAAAATTSATRQTGRAAGYGGGGEQGENDHQHRVPGRQAGRRDRQVRAEPFHPRRGQPLQQLPNPAGQRHLLVPVGAARSAERPVSGGEPDLLTVQLPFERRDPVTEDDDLDVLVTATSSAAAAPTRWSRRGRAAEPAQQVVLAQRLPAISHHRTPSTAPHTVPLGGAGMTRADEEFGTGSVRRSGSLVCVMVERAGQKLGQLIAFVW